ncbi:MAG: hypothetical protein B7733_11255, partial [Myxococcales bacterium FL481]
MPRRQASDTIGLPTIRAAVERLRAYPWLSAGVIIVMPTLACGDQVERSPWSDPPPDVGSQDDSDDDGDSDENDDDENDDDENDDDENDDDEN